MSNFVWNKTPEREQLFKQAEEIPEMGRWSKSRLLEEALREFILKHGKSNNPQTKIGTFQKEFPAMPSVIDVTGDKLDKFYSLIKTRKEYDAITPSIELLLQKHNQKLKDFD